MKLHPLSNADLDILQSLHNVVDGIATMYGKHTEVLLHSLDINNPAIVKIVNGHVTGRKVGAPITNLAMNTLKSGHDISAPYFTKSGTGKTLRSTTTVIRNNSGVAIGLLCINMNMDAPLQSVLQMLLPNLKETKIMSESFVKSTDDAVREAIDAVGHEVKYDPSIAVSKKSRVIVVKLADLGIFELKDSAQIAAKRLNISIHTIYRYLREIKAKPQLNN